MDIKIDKEFKDIFPALTAEEYNELQASIIDEGCREALVIWKGDNILLDGHNRLEICQENNISYKVIFKEFGNRNDALGWIIRNQRGRRNIAPGAMLAAVMKYEDAIKERAKENQGKRTDIVSTLTESYEPVNTRSELSEMSGLSTGTVAKGQKIWKNGTETQKEEVATGKKSVNTVYKEVKQQEKIEKETRPSKAVFNATNDNIEWAKWTWNPVTGCLHGCEYCYARDIAERFYPEKFKPTFRPERLNAPYNTTIPDKRKNESGINNVFVCSMADLFGEWVEQEWIDKIMDVVRDTPQWTYIFLTKNPMRLIGIDFPKNAWVGATLDVQSRIDDIDEAFRDIETIKFISCEPLLEKITLYEDMPIDWLIVGARSKNSKLPEFQPEWEWVESLLMQAREQGISVYFKPNLKVQPKEYPICR